MSRAGPWVTTCLALLSTPAAALLQVRPAVRPDMRRACSPLMMADDTPAPMTEEPPPTPPSAAALPTTADGEVDLAAMTFEERLEYLASQAPTEIPVEKKDEDLLFGIDLTVPDTQWWTFGFWQLIFQDLQEVTWPAPSQVGQTLVVSQIAFVALLIFILIFDATIESFMRTLIQGADFGITIDAVLKKDTGNIGS